jgi:Ca2+-transporting ATPase
MARRNVIVRPFQRQTLGAVTVIFTDKTGTLTENRMVVERFLPAGDPEAALRALVLCNNAVITSEDKPDIGDPTEVALLAFAAASGTDLGALSRDHGRLTEIPFDSTRARMTVVVGAPDGRRIAYMKGAPEVVLSLCQGVETASVRDSIATMAEEGLRVLALASRVLDPGEAGAGAERSMAFLGLVGLGDPLRAEAPAALQEATASGVRVVMLTGDHPTTAAAIGRRLGLEGRVITGVEVDQLPEDELAARSHEASVFARVTSEHKLRMIHAARRAGDIAGMTGDGVNDAPALRAADIGIAMGEGGTDVAREAADMVLMDNRFASIVEAIKQGRTIYANIQRFVHFLLACNLAEWRDLPGALDLVALARPTTDSVREPADGRASALAGCGPLDPLMQRPPRAEVGIISSAR